MFGKDRVNELEFEINHLNEKINMVDEYARQTMNQTISLLGVILTIATGIVLLAGHYYIKKSINNRVENEISKKVLNVLREKPPLFYHRDECTPDEQGIVRLPDSVEGINDLEPKTLMILETRAENSSSWGNASGLKSILKINEHGVREIEVTNYETRNGKVAFSLAWIRKEYS